MKSSELSNSSSSGQSSVNKLSLSMRWRQAWNGSLRFRLLALGLMPLVVAFPLVIAVLVFIGGERANALLISNLRSNLAGTRNYLDQIKTDAGVRVSQLVRSEKLIHLLRKESGREELNQMLSTTAQGSGLDFLVIAGADGRVIGSSTHVAPDIRIPDSYVIRQARIGVANSAYERIDGDALRAFSPQFPSEAQVALADARSGVQHETRGLLINAAAHFPLATNDTDAILIGGILLNRNFSLIEHMREIIFPVGSLPGDAEGMTAVFVEDVSVAISRQRRQGQRVVGTRAPVPVKTAVLGSGEHWLGRLEFAGESFFVGYEPIADGTGERIGMIGASFPDAPFRKPIYLLLGMIGGLLALTMLIISVVFIRAGHEMTGRLSLIGETMTQVRQGNRDARVGNPSREDELGQLSHHFDSLLDTISAQDEIRRAALQTIADEASRRRALFEHERDGVVILNMDGTVLEANPKCAAMLGYELDEFSSLHFCDWDISFTPGTLDAVLAQVGAEGIFIESVQRRKDGTCYPAEVSISRAQWGEKTFWLVLQRDIAERKAAESELAQYRLDLERLVEQRTLELNSRTEQLAAIFSLSPDGFVSFDSERRVAFANQSFLRLTGLDANQIVTMDEKKFSELLARCCLPNASFPGVAALRAARKRHAEEGPDGAHGAARRQLIELAGPGNRVLEVGIRMSEAENVSQVLYFRDVTHETEVDRMKSEFLTTAAHELRTPMASIYGYAELLMTQDFEEEDRRELAATIFRQSELMASIINELLDLARIEARRGKDFVIERVSLQEIVSEVVAGYKPPNGRVPPRIEASDEALFISVDRKKMQQAVLNIISNAYKYSPNGGDVCIAYRCEVGAGADRVGIAVSDQGIGMSETELARVCERFYRADSSGKIPGTGLGMSIVKEIVELHGGEVELTSAPGEGTTVILWIPR